MTNEIEITPEMIEAGVSELALYGGPMEIEPSRMAQWIFEAMYEAMLSHNKSDA